ncbi:MAG: DUF368 domain-containing protein [Bacilli bacterium]|nr:DUF368 domain-containing protein [Bacilli bacterium]
MNAREWFGDFARGTSLGTGMLPGVSVGTVGIIVNVYDKLLNAIDGLRKKETFVSSFLSLLPIALGCIISILVVMLFWKKVAYVYFPFIIVSALAGFVLGALPLMSKELKGQMISLPDILRMTLGFIVAAGIGISAYLSAAGILPLDLNFGPAIDAPFQNPWVFAVVLLVGFFAAVSCLIPGVSGSMVMFIFGLYNPILNLFMNEYDSSHNVIHESIFHDTSKLGGGLVVIAVLLFGILIGFFAVSKLMKSLLANHRRGTFGVIIGFVVGSVVSMFFNNDMYTVYLDPNLTQWWQWVFGGVALFAALGATYFLLARRQRKETSNIA